MDVPAVHPSRGTAGTARGADTVRSNERLGHTANSVIDLKLHANDLKTSRERLER
mgnify:CR=1 FL=1